MDIAESGHVSKDSSPHPARSRHPWDGQGGGGGDTAPSKPVRGGTSRFIIAEPCEMRKHVFRVFVLYFCLCEDQTSKELNELKVFGETKDTLFHLRTSYDTFLKMEDIFKVFEGLFVIH